MNERMTGLQEPAASDDAKYTANATCGEATPLFPKSVEDPLSGARAVGNGERNLQKNTELMGYLLIMLSVSVFACTNFLNRTAMSVYGVPSAVTYFVRGVLQMLMSVAYAAAQASMDEQWWPTVTRIMRSKSGLVVAIYGVLSASYIVLLISALERLPVSLVTPIMYSNSAFALLLAYFLVGEPFGMWELCAVTLSVGGVVLISHPSAPPLTPTTNSAPLTSTPHSSHVAGCLVAIASAFVSASAFTTLRFLPPSAPSILGVIAAVAVLTFFSILLGGVVTPPQLFSYGTGGTVTILANALAFLPMLFLTKGFQMSRSGPGTVVLTVGVPVACFLGVTFLGEVLSWMQILGTIMIVTATVVVGCREIFSRSD